jgi:hypothetical protein
LDDYSYFFTLKCDTQVYFLANMYLNYVHCICISLKLGYFRHLYVKAFGEILVILSEMIDDGDNNNSCNDTVSPNPYYLTHYIGSTNINPSFPINF